MILRLLSRDLIFCGTFNTILGKYKLSSFHVVRNIKKITCNDLVNYCNEMLA